MKLVLTKDGAGGQMTSEISVIPMSNSSKEIADGGAFDISVLVYLNYICDIIFMKTERL